MKNKLIMLLLALLFLVPVALAKSGSINLLAVQDAGNNTFKGSVVTMTLEIKPGAGRVFIESFPLTKIDTQITTRTAEQIACEYLDADCSGYDFFYTLNSSAVTVGGPSAGAATAALTVAVLENAKINDSVSITGTINAGNLIGTVGGLKEKIKAASDAGIKIVIVPFGEQISEGNKTKSLSDYSKELNISIVEASTLDDALQVLTGKKRKEPERNFSISPVYISTMSSIAQKMCNKSTQIMVDLLQENFNTGNVLDNKSLGLEQDSNNLTEKAAEAVRNGNYYSAASYCYGSSLRNIQIAIIEKNLTQNQMNKTAGNLSKEIDAYEKSADKWNLSTITNLESYIIVKSRLYEARKNLKEFYEANSTDETVLALASAIARFSSAKSWAEFYSRNGVQIEIDKGALMNSCKQKISEAEERYQYVNLYLPDLMPGSRDEIDEAMSNYKSGNYVMCLFLSAKAKADIDSVASSMGVEQSGIDLLINQRLKVARNVIAEQNAKGIFPILGYSYYEYAINLNKNNDTATKATALIYTGYALELSNLDIYFQKQEFRIKINAENLKYALVFLAGLVAGVFVYDFLSKSRGQRNRKNKGQKPNLKKQFLN